MSASAAEVATLAAGGLHPVGVVSGMAVTHLSHRNYRSRSWRPGDTWTPTVNDLAITSTEMGDEFPLAEFAQALQGSWNSALGGLVENAVTSGADGVVGISWSAERIESGAHQFIVTGSAVRSRAARRRKHPFTTSLGGAELSKLNSAGLAPGELIIMTTVAIRRRDFFSNLAMSNEYLNEEVPGFAILLSTARGMAHEAARARADALGAVGLLLAGAIRVDVSELRHHDGSDFEDDMAIATVVGDALGRREVGPDAWATANRQSAVVSLEGGRVR